MNLEEELRKRLEAEIDEVIQKTLQNRKPSGTNSLDEIEDLAIEAGKRVREEMLRVLAEEESQQQEVVTCPVCGSRMHSRGKRGKDLVSRAGETRIKRNYYVCPDCGETVFPPG
jgi:YgiT-type zinc finger domain-containing protein